MQVISLSKVVTRLKNSRSTEMTTLTVHNPATGQLLATLPVDSAESVKAKLKAGSEAFKSWKKTSAYERSALISKWAALIIEHKNDIARVMTEENGKPFKESLGEVDYAVSYLTWYAEEAKRIYGRTIPAATTNKRLMVTREGVGLVAAITPWNFPAAMMTRKAGPALAAGCTFIVKPAEDTPLTMIRLVELAHEAGF